MLYITHQFPEYRQLPKTKASCQRANSNLNVKEKSTLASYVSTKICRDCVGKFS
jgi:hypothetical protein